MAVIAVVPIIMNDVVLTIGTDNYEAHVSKVVFTPSSSVVRWKPLVAATGAYTFPTIADWVVDIDYAQDWATANSLSLYLLANEGQSKTMTFKPKKPVTTGPTATATVFITPGAIGGEVDNVATASVQLGVQGKPVITTA